MIKNLFTFLFLFAVSPVIFTQGLPPGLSGLPTVSTDYTCGGVATPLCSTWPMPTMPAAGSGWTDPNTGVELFRLAISSATVGQAVTAYSRVQAWNSDNTKMMLCETGHSAMDLYDATTVPPTPINRIATSDSSFLYTCSGDAYWSNTNPNIIYYIPLSGSGGMQLRSVNVSTCTTGSCTLTPTTIHTFSAVSDQYNPGANLASYTISGNIVTFAVPGQNYNLLTATTLGTAVTSPGSHAVTPASMANINPGMSLVIGYGTANVETITVSSITSTTFTATFANTHLTTDTVNLTVTIYDTGVSYLDGQTLTVLTTGLVNVGLGGQFESPLTHANVSTTSINGIAGLSGIPATQIESGSGGQGGFFDSTDNYFSFTADITSGNGRSEIDWIRYRKDTDTVTTQKKWYTVCPGSVPAGCAIFGGPGSIPSKEGLNMIRMNQHPNQAYIEVIWQSGAIDDAAWQIGTGTEYYSPTYTLLGAVSGYDGHNDHGYDINGVPVYVGVNGTGSNGTLNAYALNVSNLTTLNPSHVTNFLIQLPCTYAYIGSSPCGTGGTVLTLKNECGHVSMTGTWGSTPGYALSSICMVDGGSGTGVSPDYPVLTTLGTAVTSTGSHTVTPASMSQIGLGTQLLVDCEAVSPGYGCTSGNFETVTVTAVTSTTFTAAYTLTHTSSADVNNITVGDTGFGAMEMYAVKIDTTATPGSNAQFWRIGRAMSIRDGDYGAEPHAAVNRNWTAITWGSNWNVDNGTDYGFWLQLLTPTAGSVLTGILKGVQQ